MTRAAKETQKLLRYMIDEEGNITEKMPETEGYWTWTEIKRKYNANKCPFCVKTIVFSEDCDLCPVFKAQKKACFQEDWYDLLLKKPTIPHILALYMWLGVL